MFNKDSMYIRDTTVSWNLSCRVFYWHVIAFLFCILYTLIHPGQSSTLIGTAKPRLFDRSGLRHGGQYMQRHLYALFSLSIALCGILLVAVPRFFLHPPVPVGMVAQNMYRLIFFRF